MYKLQLLCGGGGVAVCHFKIKHISIVSATTLLAYDENDLPLLGRLHRVALIEVLHRAHTSMHVCPHNHREEWSLWPPAQIFLLKCAYRHLIHVTYFTLQWLPQDLLVYI